MNAVNSTILKAVTWLPFNKNTITTAVVKLSPIYIEMSWNIAMFLKQHKNEVCLQVEFSNTSR